MMLCKYPHFRSFFVIVLLMLFSFQLDAQDSVFRKEEARMKFYAGKIMSPAEDFIKFNYSDSLMQAFLKVLPLPGSNNFPFDSLKTISRLSSDDKHFRIITWAILKNDGVYEYAGLIQFREKKNDSYKTIVLTDRSNEIQNPENQVLLPENWYGALYYKIVPIQDKNASTYTILGWDGNNGLSKRKLIEILCFKPSGEIVFGASAFSGYPHKVKRIIFEYAANASMSINYDYQYLFEKQRTGKKIKTRHKLKHMIVFDRLSPSHPSMEGQYQFYLPETNVFDAFVFERGKWKYVKDIDARNGPRELKKKPRAVRYELFQGPEEEKK
jgi:hypothetical protein